MSIYNHDYTRSPLFAPKPWDFVFFEDSPPPPPAETASTVDQLPRAPLSPFSADFGPFNFAESAWEIDGPAPVYTNFPPAIPDALPPASLPRDWQPLSAEKIQALLAADFAVPDFAAMPPVPFPADPAPAILDPATVNPTLTPAPVDNVPPMAEPAPSIAPPSRAEPVPAAVSRRRKAYKQLVAMREGTEAPKTYRRGRKCVPLDAPKAKYTKRVPGVPKPPPKPKRVYKKRVAAPADMASVRVEDAATVREEIS